MKSQANARLAKRPKVLVGGGRFETADVNICLAQRSRVPPATAATATAITVAVASAAVAAAPAAATVATVAAAAATTATVAAATLGVPVLLSMAGATGATHGPRRELALLAHGPCVRGRKVKSLGRHLQSETRRNDTTP